ncbi:MAG: DUF3326 domain-containing protein [Anaerolineae bacterium]|nr:DUF3326 domain-containing protein [Anaerolineae bacterium]
MKIENRVYRFKAERQNSWLDTISTSFAQQLEENTYPLRFSIVDMIGPQIVIEATIVRFSSDNKYAEALRDIEVVTPRKKAFQGSPFGVVQIVPTGIRCEVGGFAGDACPATNLLASTVDFLVTHPNAVNASELNEMAGNILYVEGKALDDFLLGHLALLPVRSNKISTFVDPTGLDYIDYVVNTLNAARAVKGINCATYAVLRDELGVSIEWSETGCAVGTVLNPMAILEAVEHFIEYGTQAVGGVSVIAGVTKEMFAKHLRGEIPNPSGGIEAIITHLISKLFKIPTAHAPLPYYQDIKEKDTINPRASAEFISTPHYFCVLKGLAKAPHLVPLSTLENVAPHLTSLNNIGAIIMPADALGGIPALVAEYSEIPLIAVTENQTVLNMTNERMKMRNVIEVSSYLEAAGVVVALREGISLESLRRPLVTAQQLDLPEEVAPLNEKVH